MTVFAVDSPAAVCPYERQASFNFDLNRAAFAVSQPTLAELLATLPAADGQWLLARDGSLTLRTSAAWWQGCSLPLRAARQQLKSMDVGGPIACFLDPLHAAHLRVTLDNLKPSQAVLAIIPEIATLPVLLAAEDFAADIDAHRLWIVAGEDWPTQTQRLYGDQPGLPTPMQFVRLAQPSASRLDPVIAEAQRIFQAVTQQRSVAAQAMLQSWQPAPRAARRLCVLTGSHFRLNDDAALALAEAAATVEYPTSVLAVNADDPATGATLALVQAATDCGALLSADISRTDLPEVLPKDLPWLTWLTQPRIPTAHAACVNDLLLVADPAWRDAAIVAGWPASSVVIAGWPSPPPAVALPTRIDGVAESRPYAAVIADTEPLDPPDRLEEFSSHILLWNSIRQELQADAFAAGVDADVFLRSRAKRYGVDHATLDHRLFVYGLIWQATIQGVARRLINDSHPIRLYGTGWADIPDLAAAAAGPVVSRAHLASIAAGAAAIVDVRPATWQNGLYGLRPLTLPIIRVAGRTMNAIRHDLSQALAQGHSASPGRSMPSLDLSSLLSWLRGQR